MPLFRICSGQNAWPNGRLGWSICLYDTPACPWWRPEDSAGRQRRFATPEKAETYRLNLESKIAPHLGDLAMLAAVASIAKRDPVRRAYGAAIHTILKA